MRKYFLFLLLSLLYINGVGYAQSNDRVLRKTVKTNTEIKTKIGYNQFLVDMTRDIDTAYVRYERLVQKVWDKELIMDLYGSSKDAVKSIEKSKEMMNSMPVFLGGDNYRNTVLKYADVVKKKIQYLEKLGVLGADPLSDINDYNTILVKFQETTNEAIESKNKIRKSKEEFEKSTYIKVKK